MRAAQDAARFGGKAASLAAAMAAGIAVPDGFALSPEAVDAVVRGDASTLAALARAIFGGPTAVRSSAIGEDSAEASFAGQHATKLNATTSEEIVAAIHEVWASGRTEAALGYRARMGIGGEPRVAVVVQAMIDPDCAGVLFTRNPIDGADERVIEAAWGLGEAVVAGLVTPDSFRVSRAGLVLARRAGHKDIAIRPNPRGGTDEVAVDLQRAAALCLDDRQLARLNDLATRCETRFLTVAGGALDIEWAFARGELHLLQSRAVTA